MSEAAGQQPPPIMRPRSARGTKNAAKKPVAAFQSQTSEPPIEEKWGEFPTKERQAELRRVLEKWQSEQDHEDSLFSSPFGGVELSGADVYWLAALAAGAGDVSAGKKLLDKGVYVKLSNLHLEEAILLNAHLERSLLAEAHLERSLLAEAHLEGALLKQAHLEGAHLAGAHLEGANLIGAYLGGAILFRTHLEGADLREADLTSQPNLHEATFDVKTQLAQARLDATLQVADVAWNGVLLIRLPWEQVPRLGDETIARQASREAERKYQGEKFDAAARAYRQLALALQGQGITDVADRFTYRAFIMQRKALWWHFRNRKGSKLGAYLFSLFLAVLTGYGFRLWRIIAAYTLLILAFATAYWSLDLQTPHIYTFWQALILSVTAFHGRVFSNPFLLTEPQIVVTAIEAIFGLVIEGVFIAMLTQRFFNR